jgi:hypothetical protein
MLALKRIVTVAVMVYLLLALLFVLAPAVRTTLMDMGSGLSVLEKERSFYYTLFLIGAGLLALHLITENLDSVLLRRSVSQQENRINELKAKLYDHQQRGAAPVGVPTARTVDGRSLNEPVQPTFPQSDPSLPNTAAADRQPLA